MSMFPGPGAHVYHNEDGEPLGWDYPADDPDPASPGTRGSPGPKSSR